VDRTWAVDRAHRHGALHPRGIRCTTISSTPVKWSVYTAGERWCSACIWRSTCKAARHRGLGHQLKLSGRPAKRHLVAPCGDAPTASPGVKACEQPWVGRHRYAPRRASAPPAQSQVAAPTGHQLPWSGRAVARGRPPNLRRASPQRARWPSRRPQPSGRHRRTSYSCVRGQRRTVAWRLRGTSSGWCALPHWLGSTRRACRPVRSCLTWQLVAARRTASVAA
jgi:hypothetical protein